MAGTDTHTLCSPAAHGKEGILHWTGVSKQHMSVAGLFLELALERAAARDVAPEHAAVERLGERRSKKTKAKQTTSPSIEVRERAPDGGVARRRRRRRHSQASSRRGSSRRHLCVVASRPPTGSRPSPNATASLRIAARVSHAVAVSRARIDGRPMALYSNSIRLHITLHIRLPSIITSCCILLHIPLPGSCWRRR